MADVTSRGHHVLRRGSLIGPRSAGRLGTGGGGGGEGIVVTSAVGIVDIE